jgi:phosphoribosylanthranilate isomerase
VTSMPQLIIKICGVTHDEHVLAAAECGADLIGLVLWTGSARYVGVDRAIELAALARSRRLEAVALVVNPDDTLLQHAQHFDRIQFHGDEPCERLAGWSKPTIRGFGFSPEALTAWNTCPHADWLIVDGPRGGSGRAFDHETLVPFRAHLRKPWLVAGGLTCENVAMVIKRLQPTGVDVSSGVERTRGVKDAELIRRFCTEARASA